MPAHASRGSALRTVDHENHSTEEGGPLEEAQKGGTINDATAASPSPVTTANRRLVVELTPDTAAKLALLASEEGHNKTTVVNRALQVYEFLKGIDAAGGKILVQEPGSREQQWLRLL